MLINTPEYKIETVDFGITVKNLGQGDVYFLTYKDKIVLSTYDLTECMNYIKTHYKKG